MTAGRIPFSTQHFVWLHVPKTGGTWLYPVLKRLAPKSWDVQTSGDAHIMVREIAALLPKERQQLPVLAHVRNPWDWYVSLYFWMEQHRVNGTGAFALPRAQWALPIQIWVDRISQGNHIEGFREALPVFAREVVRGNWTGQTEFLSVQRAAMVRASAASQPHPQVRMIRFERLREGTIEAIEATGAEVPDAMRDAILTSRPTNTSGHSHYSHCYTPELVELVARKERALIRWTGYRFEQEG